MKTRWIYAAATAASIAFAAPMVYADEVSMRDLPQPVRDTVQREIGQAQITEIERDHEGGHSIYEVEYRENGQRFELDVNEDGQLLKRHQD